MFADFLNKLRSQPDNVKKIIIWVTAVIIGILMFILWWFFIFQKTIKNFNSEALKKSFNAQDLEAKMKDFPKIEIPKISEEDLKKITATGEK